MWVKQGALSGAISGGIYGGIAASQSQFDRSLLFGTLTRSGRQQAFSHYAEQYNLQANGAKNIKFADLADAYGTTKPLDPNTGQPISLAKAAISYPQGVDSEVTFGLNRLMSLKKIRANVLHEGQHVIDLIYLSIFSILPVYMINRFGSRDTLVFLQLSILGFLLFFVPQLILHINYYMRNRGDIFFYYPAGQRITINRKGESASFSFSDIELIKRFKSYPLAENRMQWFPWDNYNYSIIRLKNGHEFIITSLLVPNMDLPIDFGRIKLKKRFYPIIQDM